METRVCQFHPTNGEQLEAEGAIHHHLAKRDEGTLASCQVSETLQQDMDGVIGKAT